MRSRLLIRHRRNNDPACPALLRHLQINASGYHTSTAAAPIEIHIFFSRSRLYLVPEGAQAQNPGLCRVLHSGVD